MQCAHGRSALVLACAAPTPRPACAPAPARAPPTRPPAAARCRCAPASSGPPLQRPASRAPPTVSMGPCRKRRTDDPPDAKHACMHARANMDCGHALRVLHKCCSVGCSAISASLRPGLTQQLLALLLAVKLLDQRVARVGDEERGPLEHLGEGRLCEQPASKQASRHSPHRPAVCV